MEVRQYGKTRFLHLAKATTRRSLPHNQPIRPRNTDQLVLQQLGVLPVRLISHVAAFTNIARAPPHILYLVHYKGDYREFSIHNEPNPSEGPIRIFQIGPDNIARCAPQRSPGEEFVRGGIRTSAALPGDHVRYLTIDNRKQPGSQVDLSDMMGTLWSILTGLRTLSYDGPLYQPTLQKFANFFFADGVGYTT